MRNWSIHTFKAGCFPVFYLISPIGLALAQDNPGQSLSNDHCWNGVAGEGAQLIEIPSLTTADTRTATDNSNELGFCCHEEQFLDHRFVTNRAAGTVWFKFVATDTSARLTTCCNAPDDDGSAGDSLIQVFEPADSDRGLCWDGKTPCSVTDQDCPDHNRCVLDQANACESLMSLACNDDDETCACGGESKPRRSSLCVTGLVPGRLYFVAVGAKSDADRGVYLLDISSPCTLDPPPLSNDLCQNAELIVSAPDEKVTILFDASGQTFGEAPANVECPQSSDILFCARPLPNDIWYDWVAPCTGRALVDTCDPERSLETQAIIYQGCDCPIDPDGPYFACQDFVFIPGCFLSTRLLFSAEKDQCYKIRLSVSPNQTTLPGDLHVQVRCNCPEGPIDFIDPPDGVVDARKPVTSINPSTFKGTAQATFTSQNEIDRKKCWSACQTEFDSIPLRVLLFTHHEDGTSELTMNRPVTPGAKTDISYTDLLGQTFSTSIFSHPGNVNGDEIVSSVDIETLMGVMEGMTQAPWGPYSTDCDRSGETTPVDLLCVIDLLNGAEGRPWLNTTLPLPDRECLTLCGGSHDTLCIRGRCVFDTGDCIVPGSTGVCFSQQTTCPDDIEPVCGCNGVTYDNECLAHNAGQSIFRSGECGSICAGPHDLTCPMDEFCNLENGECDAQLTFGTCQSRPQVCTIPPLDPVCGCDGNTYRNACLAGQALVSIDHPGPCDP